MRDHHQHNTTQHNIMPETLQLLTRQNTLPILTKFREIIVPAQSIPELGDIVELVSPSEYGIHRRHGGHWYKITDEIVFTEILPSPVVLFAAQSNILLANLIICGQPVSVSVRGRILYSPVPTPNNPLWERARFDRCARTFIGERDGQPFIKADLMMLAYDRNSTVVHVIRDASSL